MCICTLEGEESFDTNLCEVVFSSRWRFHQLEELVVSEREREYVREFQGSEGFRINSRIMALTYLHQDYEGVGYYTECEFRHLCPDWEINLMLTK